MQIKIFSLEVENGWQRSLRKAILRAQTGRIRTRKDTSFAKTFRKNLKNSIRDFEKSAAWADFLRLNSFVNEGRSVI